MGKMLTGAQIEAYERDGYVFPLSAFSAAEARRYRDGLEAYEADTGDVIHSNMRHKVHLLFRWADEIVHHPRILDAVEDLLGPDLLCWTTNFFIKEANDPAFVSWHQDSTYWGLDPHDVVTAWVALSDAPLESGPDALPAGLAQARPDGAYRQLRRGQPADARGRRSRWMSMTRSPWMRRSGAASSRSTISGSCTARSRTGSPTGALASRSATFPHMSGR